MANGLHGSVSYVIRGDGEILWQITATRCNALERCSPNAVMRKIGGFIRQQLQKSEQEASRTYTTKPVAEKRCTLSNRSRVSMCLDCRYTCGTSTFTVANPSDLQHKSFLLICSCF
ncbi:unnamed protein product [Victoria cruziana]